MCECILKVFYYIEDWMNGWMKWFVVINEYDPNTDKKPNTEYSHTDNIKLGNYGKNYGNQLTMLLYIVWTYVYFRCWF